jgi:integrase
VVWHGLRATGLTWSAEGGASERALMALAGHLTAAMSQRYTRGAERNRLARDAVAAIEMPATGTDGKPNVLNGGSRHVLNTGSATS